MSSAMLMSASYALMLPNWTGGMEVAVGDTHSYHGHTMALPSQLAMSLDDQCFKIHLTPFADRKGPTIEAYDSDRVTGDELLKSMVPSRSRLTCRSCISPSSNGAADHHFPQAPLHFGDACWSTAKGAAAVEVRQLSSPVLLRSPNQVWNHILNGAKGYIFVGLQSKVECVRQIARHPTRAG